MADGRGASVKDSESGPELAESLVALRRRYRSVRRFSDKLRTPLTAEDCVIQSMPDVSPTRWHLAHTTWFFETFVLSRAVRGYRSHHPAFEYLFNSYYNSVGDQFPRERRGLLSRPGLGEVLDYRQFVDKEMERVFDELGPADPLLPVIELGLQHEQQHQELILTDIKHVLSCNPLLPAYRPRPSRVGEGSSPMRWLSYQGGLEEIGFTGEEFAFDCETPRHTTYVPPFQLASRLVTNGEFLEFMAAGGYARPEYWLSLGWNRRKSERWESPLYWYHRDGAWHEFTLNGLEPLDLDAPVCHISYFEADAYARWAETSLPTEAQWEIAAREFPLTGNFVENDHFHPLAAPVGHGASQFYGDAWEWTSSPYTPYPGYVPAAGALGEYNGKFMCNQYVLRGGSCATSQTHIRPTYRNFFPPEARWQFTGIRLAK